MSIKLIAVDIDGTLVNSKKEITPEVLQLSKMPKQLESRLSLQQDAPIAGVAKLLDDLQLRDEVTML